MIITLYLEIRTHCIFWLWRPISLVLKHLLGKVRPVLKTTCSQLSIEHKKKSISFQHLWENQVLKRTNTWTKLIVNMVQVSFLKLDFLSDAGMELTCSGAQMKAENMKFSKLVQLCPKGPWKPEILVSKH